MQRKMKNGPCHDNPKRVHIAKSKGETTFSLCNWQAWGKYPTRLGDVELSNTKKQTERCSHKGETFLP